MTDVERLRMINDEPEVLDCDFLFNPPITELPSEEAEKSIQASKKAAQEAKEKAKEAQKLAEENLEN